MFEEYFQPLTTDVISHPESRQVADLLADKVSAYTSVGRFPDIEGIRIALFGVGEERGAIDNDGCSRGADFIRRYFYQLKSHQQSVAFADFGNLRPGSTLDDTYAAIATVVSECLTAHVIPVILGGSQDLTYGHYLGYKKSEQIINIVSLDSLFDLGVPDGPTNNDNYMGRIILEQPNYLFNYGNLGYQTCFTGSESIALMKKLHFDAMRLGQVQTDILEAEPVIRSADMLSVDISSVRMSDAPGHAQASPNGFYGEELCQLMMYAGLSDKLTGLGLYEYNPEFDRQGQSAQLYAQALWYFFEGVSQRKADLPMVNPNQYMTYRVAFEELEEEITFLKSLKSDRWWIKLPADGSRNRYISQHMLPCSYKDYQQACHNQVPERWWNAVHKMV